ncbi:Peptidase M23 [Kribbella flavida DSM 17836]|uniref:Peptidase M23 n=1 Tax=Kribbella flavida (strain DSM 17836 / JCM 10339 / NBRC 14399) TaxID=479435 RepID=D2PS66_KRIFD|nr:GNAT family N-acetyltransferase [Kribbella flavida]ADB31190.1 Peptidase M23 [Kribbella flavida DSM 17836]
MAAPVHNAVVVREFGATGEQCRGGVHPGRDYRAEHGTAVRATLAGVVVQVEGDRVVVESNGIWHLYSHLSEPAVRRGDTVETGDQLGLALGPHLHYEERVTPYRPADRRNPRFDVHVSRPAYGERVIATRFDTDRLALLPLSPEYAEPMARVLSAPELYSFIGGEPPSLEQLAERYQRQVAGSGRPGEHWLNWVLRLRPDDVLVGYVQATVTGDEAEIAWVVGADWQGRGIAREAATGLVGWLRGQGLERIVAHVHPEHAASAAVASAAGLSRTEQLDDGEQLWVLQLR